MDGWMCGQITTSSRLIITLNLKFCCRKITKFDQNNINPIMFWGQTNLFKITFQNKQLKKFGKKHLVSDVQSWTLKVLSYLPNIFVIKTIFRFKCFLGSQTQCLYFLALDFFCLILRVMLKPKKFYFYQKC